MMMLIAVIGCGTKEKTGKSGFAKLALVNSASSLALTQNPTTYTPSQFGVKLLSVRIVPDFDASQNPQGVSPLIWANPACKVGMATSSKKDGDTEINTEYSTIEGDCTDEMVSTYFELGRSTEEVNAELNSQNLKVLPGTYKYVTMEFCIGGAKTNNAKFMADGMSEAYAVKLGTCGINSVEANPPIVVGEDEAVTVSVQYSLADIVYDYGEGMTKNEYCYFSEDSSIRRCVNMPAIVPSFTKQ